MNIIHFSKSDDKGAFLAAYRFHKQLQADGHESVMLVAKKTVTEDDVVEVKLNPVQWFVVKLIKVLSAWLIKQRTNPRFYFFNYFEGFSFPVSAIKKSMPFVPDIIVTHWVTGFVNNNALRQLNKVSKAPVVWRFNDMNAFTGGCHYSNGCEKYFVSCGNCPALNSPGPNDRSAKNLAAKINAISDTDITFVSSTSEIDEQLTSSAISRHSKTKLILLSVNSPVFKPVADTTVIKKALGLPTDKKIIFFGAQNMTEPRKGFKELAAALQIVKRSISQALAKDVLLVYSTNVEDPSLNWAFEALRLPYLKDDQRLANIYNAATLFVSPSIEDAGPMMLPESMLCGTPLVSFAVGLAKDAIINNVSGFIVPPYDIDKFAEGIQTILEMESVEYDALSGRCRQKGVELFSEERETAAYDALFKTLINNRLQLR